MFSSDKNVESIAQLIEVLKDYMGLQKEYLKLDVIEKVVRLVTALILAFVLVVLGIAVMFYLSLAVAYWLTPVIGTGWAFFIIAPKKSDTKGELIANLISNSITAIDAFLLVRKLMKSYGHLFGKKKRR